MTFWKKFFWGNCFVYPFSVCLRKRHYISQKSIWNLFSYWLFNHNWKILLKLSYFFRGPKNDFWSFILCISIFSWEGKKGEQIFQCKYEFFFCFLFKITNKRKNGLVLNDFLQKYRDDTKFRENARPLKFCLFFISVSYVRNNFF